MRNFYSLAFIHFAFFFFLDLEYARAMRAQNMRRDGLESARRVTNGYARRARMDGINSELCAIKSINLIKIQKQIAYQLQLPHICVYGVRCMCA